jgi:hypothetical protein
MTVDYTLCPCGKPLRKVAWADLLLVPGCLACPDAPQTEAAVDARWVSFLCAWVCPGGWLKYRRAEKRALEEHRPLPAVNPKLIAETKAERAAIRGMGRHIPDRWEAA